MSVVVAAGRSFLSAWANAVRRTAEQALVGMQNLDCQLGVNVVIGQQQVAPERLASVSEDQ